MINSNNIIPITENESLIFVNIDQKLIIVIKDWK